MPKARKKCFFSSRFASWLVGSRQVLDQGSLHGTREPSAACIGRISKIQTLGSRLPLEAGQRCSLVKIEAAAASGRRVWRAGDLPAWMMWRVSSMMPGRYQKKHLSPLTSPIGPSQTPVVEENRLDQRAAAALEGAPPMVGTSEPHPRTDEIDPRADIYGKMM